MNRRAAPIRILVLLMIASSLTLFATANGALAQGRPAARP